MKKMTEYVFMFPLFDRAREISLSHACTRRTHTHTVRSRDSRPRPSRTRTHTLFIARLSLSRTHTHCIAILIAACSLLRSQSHQKRIERNLSLFKRGFFCTVYSPCKFAHRTVTPVPFRFDTNTCTVPPLMETCVSDDSQHFEVNRLQRTNSILQYC